MAQMIVYSADGSELIFPVEDKTLKIGDLVLLEINGTLPAAVKILVGSIELSDNRQFVQGDITPLSGNIINGRAKGYVAEIKENQNQ